MKENNISWANWSLSNKNESSAMLITGAPSNKISEEYLSESGIIVRDALKNWQNLTFALLYEPINRGE